MDVLTKEQRQKNKKAIKKKGTKIEEVLVKALWAKGLRYRKNTKGDFGKPELGVIPRSHPNRSHYDFNILTTINDRQLEVEKRLLGLKIIHA